jgi:hypothetical protein
VAIIGARKPYSNPAKALPGIPIISHKIKITVAAIRSRSFTTGPTILVLPWRKKGTYNMSIQTRINVLAKSETAEDAHCT